jgi:aspartyl-tRNA(Asn)/glutamyl-tRNA(Gln) amidotransferase subunit A
VRLGVPQTLVLDSLDDTVGRAFQRALRQLAAQGAQLIDLPLPHLRVIHDLNQRPTFAAVEAYAWHRKLMESKAALYDPRVLQRIRGGAGVTAADYLDLCRLRRELMASVDTETEFVDALVMPTIPMVAPRMDAISSDAEYFALVAPILRNTALVNFLDRCALSLPCHHPGELPVGMMLVGAHGRDHSLLSMGCSVEHALKRME